MTPISFLSQSSHSSHATSSRWQASPGHAFSTRTKEYAPHLRLTFLALYSIVAFLLHLFDNYLCTLRRGCRATIRTTCRQGLIPLLHTSSFLEAPQRTSHPTLAAIIQLRIRHTRNSCIINQQHHKSNQESRPPRRRAHELPSAHQEDETKPRHLPDHNHPLHRLSPNRLRYLLGTDWLQKRERSGFIDEWRRCIESRPASTETKNEDDGN